MILGEDVIFGEEVIFGGGDVVGGGDIGEDVIGVRGVRTGLCDSWAHMSFRGRKTFSYYSSRHNRQMPEN